MPDYALMSGILGGIQQGRDRLFAQKLDLAEETRRQRLFDEQMADLDQERADIAQRRQRLRAARQKMTSGEYDAGMGLLFDQESQLDMAFMALEDQSAQVRASGMSMLNRLMEDQGQGAVSGENLLNAYMAQGRIGEQEGNFLRATVRHMPPEKASIVLDRYAQDVETGIEPMVAAISHELQSQATLYEKLLQGIEQQMTTGPTSVGFDHDQLVGLQRRKRLAERARLRVYRMMGLARQTGESPNIEDHDPIRLEQIIDLAEESLSVLPGEPPTEDEVIARTGLLLQRLGYTTEAPPSYDPGKDPIFQFLFQQSADTLLGGQQ